jgi:dUTP pyrophosphatase
MCQQDLLVKIQRINRRQGLSDNPIPAYATPGSAGVDLCAYITENIIIKPGERIKVPTGLAIELPDPKVVALVCPRSGLASRHGISLTNAVGVIDSDYRGEIQILMINHGKEPFTIKHGDRIAQMLFVPVYIAAFAETGELTDTERGCGGFGSTGI